MGNHRNNVHYPSSGITSLPWGNNFFSCKQKLLCKFISSLCYVFPFASKSLAFPLLQSLSLDSKLESIFSKKQNKKQKKTKLPECFSKHIVSLFHKHKYSSIFFLRLIIYQSVISANISDMYSVAILPNL